MQLARNRRRTLHHEQIPYAVAGSTFAATRFTTTHWPLQWHDHPELELTWIVRGAGLRYVADVVDEFSAGEVILLGPGVPHSWTSEPQPGHSCESIVAQFPVDALGSGWREISELRPLATLFTRAGLGLQLLGATAAAIRQELTQLITLSPGPRRMAHLLTILALIAAAPTNEVQALARLAGGPTPTTRRADPWAQIVRHLHDAAATSLSMASLAARMGLAPPSFARAFRRRFGVTCTVYLTRISLARACRELLDPQRSIAACAFTAGFGNLANFNRHFKTVYGLTPSAWRRRQLVP